MQTTLKVLDFNFTISVLRKEEISSPHNPKMGNVIKYLVEVKSENNGLIVDFDFFGSIADCRSKERALIARIEQFRQELGGTRLKEMTETRITDLDFPKLFEQAKGFMRECREMRGQFSDTKGAGAHTETVHFLRVLLDKGSAGVFPGGAHIKEIDADGLKFAFYCLVSDADAANMDIDEFSAEFGYKKVSECLRVYRACQANAAKLVTLGIAHHQICDILNELQEQNIG